MTSYKKILVAVDLSQDAALILDKAREMAARFDAEMSMVHVIEPIAIGYAIEISSIDIEGIHQEAAHQAKETLLNMGRNIGIPEQRLHTLLGQPAREIRELAHKIEADLIIMGNHGRHGWELLLGSTSSGVSHGIKCDLLTIHV